MKRAPALVYRLQGTTLGPVAAQGAHPQLDEALALCIGGDHDLVDHAALAVAQAGGHVLLGEALRYARLLVRQRRRLQSTKIREALTVFR